MLTLAHGTLAVDLVDPVADAHLLGPRFCAGGYVWQVRDLRHGPLLSGPEYPAPRPTPFNGQGLPESFRDRTRAGDPLLWSGDEGLAPGAGRLARDPAGRILVTEPCRWQIEPTPDQLTFATEQATAVGHYTLTRTIRLDHRTLVSATRFTNRGRLPLALQWFAHPFFALDDHGLITTTVPAGTRLPADTGFVLDGATLRLRRRFHGVDDGSFALLVLPPGQPLATTLTHPTVGRITFTTSFAPSECPVWANGHTFSIEPYQRLRLEPGESRTWDLRYTFGD